MVQIKNIEKLRFIYIEQTHRLWKSVKSLNLCKSVIQTSYDIVKAHGGEIKVASQEGVDLQSEEGTIFTIQIPTK